MNTLFIIYCIVAGCALLVLTVLCIYNLYLRIEGVKYSEEDMISFGRYLLGDERNERIENEQLRSEVGDWDIANWENQE